MNMLVICTQWRILPSKNVCFSVQNGQSAISIAQRLGYISVVETLKVVTETTIITTTTTTTEEKYQMVSPETMQETFMSDSEDEGGRKFVQIPVGSCDVLSSIFIPFQCWPFVLKWETGEIENVFLPNLESFLIWLSNLVELAAWFDKLYKIVCTLCSLHFFLLKFIEIANFVMKSNYVIY